MGGKGAIFSAESERKILEIRRRYNDSTQSDLVAGNLTKELRMVLLPSLLGLSSGGGFINFLVSAITREE
jgi:hypothetical protein